MPDIFTDCWQVSSCSAPSRLPSVWYDNRMSSASLRKAAHEPAFALPWAKVLAWRLQRQHLHLRLPREAMLEVVAHICGLHAQVMFSAELTLWARLDGLDPAAVRRALWEERSLVKTWSMRGTLHLLPAAEFRLWQAALSRRRHYFRETWLRYFGITRGQLEQLLAAVAEALDGRMLTRDELAKEVSRLTGSEGLGDSLRGSWGALLKPAAYLGYLCFAPSRGQNVRFTRPSSWLSPSPGVDPDQAMLEITRRYLGAYGPATRDDLARWWGGTSAEARALIQALGEEVVEVDVEGTRAWMLATHVGEIKEASSRGTVRLLPAFDQYVVAAPRSTPEVLPSAFKARVYRAQGWLSPVLLVDGRMEGVWRHEKKGTRLEVVIEPFTRVPAWARRAAKGEAERLAAFIGGELELSWST